jgi:peptidoglycan/xylan/chitin deacetylase (PgdA/CDA1 family)
MSVVAKAPSVQASRANVPVNVPILTYHSLDSSGAVTSVQPEQFAAHMQSLASRGFHGITVRELVEAWEGRGQLPARPVVLTFDDGYANLANHAAPVLSQHGFRATIFAVSGRVGGWNDWPDQGLAIPRLPLLDWTGLFEMTSIGCEIGAHTITHRKLTTLSPDDACNEILFSKRHLEDRLGIPVTSFAYPFGDFNGASAELVNQYFQAGCTVDFGMAKSTHVRARLPRYDVFYLRNPAVFQWFGTGFGAAYLAGRRFGRTLKSALGTL